MTYRLLVTGSRRWTDQAGLRHAILWEVRDVDGPITLVHGGAEGADLMADALCWSNGWTPEVHWAKDFPTPTWRNDHMVSLGADKCLAFALTWASGTGQCARAARRAGIETIDYGIDTRSGRRP